MSATILKPGRQVEEHELRRSFYYVDEPGAGASFPRDPQGNLLPGLHPAAIENFTNCLRLTEAARMVDEGVVDEVSRYYEPPVIECIRCHHEVTLDDAWLSSCHHCGADYNGSGQLLAPRHLWGEETGEHPADLVNL